MTDNNSAITISIIGFVEVVTTMMMWPDTQAVWTDTEFDGVRSSGTRGQRGDQHRRRDSRFLHLQSPTGLNFRSSRLLNSSPRMQNTLECKMIDPSVRICTEFRSA
jgi:hypothetical protein